VDAVDFSTPAVARASGHCRHHRHLRFHVSDLLRFRAAAPYDLVLCSEVLYYLWNPERLRREVRSRLGQLVAPGGDLLVVWGGIRLPQDWRAVLTHGGRLQAMHDEIVEDPVRPYRLLLLRGAPSVHGGES
jgi:SAM-dependent methyltransferase